MEYIPTVEKTKKIEYNFDIPYFKKEKLKYGGEKEYTEKEIKIIAKQMNEIANKYTANKSKWSGKVIISNRKTNAKLWNCNIEIERMTCPHAILHEQLHAHSISYYDLSTYKKYKRIEEATVELFAKEICKKENIFKVPTSYDMWVNNLIEINKKINISNDSFTFAKKIFDKPVTERLEFLEDEIQKYLSNKSIDEAIELNKLMEDLYV